MGTNLSSRSKCLRHWCLNFYPVSTATTPSFWFVASLPLHLKKKITLTTFSLSFQQWTHEQLTQSTFSRIRVQFPFTFLGLTQCHTLPLSWSSQCCNSTLECGSHSSQPCGEQWPKVAASTPGLLSEQRCSLSCSSYSKHAIISQMPDTFLTDKKLNDKTKTWSFLPLFRMDIMAWRHRSLRTVST